MEGYCFSFYAVGRKDKMADICDGIGPNCLGFARDPDNVFCFLLVFQDEKLVDKTRVITENEVFLNWIPKGSPNDRYVNSLKSTWSSQPPNEHITSAAVGKGGWDRWTLYRKKSSVT